MARRGVDRLALTRCRPVAQAVVRRAEVGAPLDHLALEALGRRRHAARGHRRRRGEGVARPLPDVPAHVVEAVAVRGERADGRRPLEAVELQVLPRELALPRVRRRLALDELLVAPREARAVEAAAGRVLPLGLRRQRLARPGRVRLGVLVRDVDDRMAVAAVDRRAAARRPAPRSARDVAPPVVPVAQVDRPAVFVKTSEPGTSSSGSASG